MASSSGQDPGGASQKRRKLLHGDATIGPDAGKAECGAMVGLLWHQDCVYLDIHDGVHRVLTNILTGESVVLPLADWQLVFGEDGSAALASGDGAGEGEVLLVQDILKQEVFKHTGSGELFVQMGNGHGSSSFSL